MRERLARKPSEFEENSEHMKGGRGLRPSEPVGFLPRTKPTYEELEARVHELEAECMELRCFRDEQKELEKRLSNALTQVLSGYLPICARCKRIREEDGVWSQIETYIQAHTQAVFSHSLCPRCAKSYYPEFLTPEE